MEVCEVVAKYLRQRRITIRELAESIDVTHPTVINWRDGRTAPETDMLCRIVLRNRDWRMDFALECLAAKDPEVWGKEGIWSLARGRRDRGMSG